MKSVNILLNLLPTELKNMLENKDMENILTYFMSNEISDEKISIIFIKSCESNKYN